MGGPDKMEILKNQTKWSKAANGEYGSRAKRNPYKYVPYEIEAEKWAQKEYRKFWKDKCLTGIIFPFVLPTYNNIYISKSPKSIIFFSN